MSAAEEEQVVTVEIDVNGYKKEPVDAAAPAETAANGSANGGPHVVTEDTNGDVIVAESDEQQPLANGQTEVTAAEDSGTEEVVETNGKAGHDVEEEKKEVKTEVVENGERSPSPLPGVSIHIGEYLQMMQAGTDLQKVRKSKTYRRIYRLDGDLLSISWNSRSKKGNKARIAIKQIQDVRKGRSTDSFKVAASAAAFPEETCFSVIYLDGGKHLSLDLVAGSVHDAEAWMTGLGTLIKEKDTGAHRSRVRERWLRDLFEDADKNGDGTLDLKEVIVMLRGLNVGVSKKVIKKKFEAADTEGSDQRLDFEEFCGLFKELASRPEVKRLFHLYSSKSEWLTADDLQRFLQLEQGRVEVTVEECSKLIGQYEATDEGKAKGLMSIDGFTSFLLGPENDLFNCDHLQVYQDMTHSLSDYHIASSHNTYLLQDQLKGPSSVEAYIRALQKGCRCVELDCWDGDDGEPVIFHGHTLTSKILFKDVIVAIKEHSFATSPYPVILSIENHCSIPQQTKMAEYFEAILGDMLCKHPVPEGETRLPSPESLKGKILIKGKKLNTTQETDDDGEVSDEDEAAEVDVSGLLAEGGVKEGGEKEGGEKGEKKEGTEGEGQAKTNGDTSTTAAAENGEATSTATTSSPGPSDEEDPPPKTRTYSFRKKKQPSPPATSSKKKKVKLSTQLSKCINYVQSVHFKGFDDWGEHGAFYQMSSFGESSATKYSSRTNCTAFMMYNKKQLSRIYPAGRRVDSSNYNPVDMWNSGCQIVALNYQTQDLSMDLNDGKFQQNGKAGYILKPRVQREEMSRFDFHDKTMPGLHPKLYTITVISGQALPKPPGGNKSGEVIDPYIVVNTYGRPEDQNMFKTKTIQDNGFNPVWNQSFSLVVHAPDYTYIRFKVMDEDWGPNADDFIGQFSASLESIMPGYRHIHLTCSGNALENASLFVHVSIMDYIGATPRSGKTSFKTKKNREYPANSTVGLPAIDTIYHNCQQSLRRAVDMREDFTFAYVMFKESCGHGPQAIVSDCVQLMAVRAKAANVTISLDVVGESKASQVYKVEYTGTAPQTLLAMITSFNNLNQAIQTLLLHGETLATDLKKAYNDCSGQHVALKSHLQEIGANSRKINTTMERYGYITCTLTLQADRILQSRETAVTDLKLIVEAAQGNEIDMKTKM